MSKEKKSIEVQRRPAASVDKENQIDRRRKELARQRETREKLIKEQVYCNEYMYLNLNR